MPKYFIIKLLKIKTNAESSQRAMMYLYGNADSNKQ
jgi:hypothetical protein